MRQLIVLAFVAGCGIATSPMTGPKAWGQEAPPPPPACDSGSDPDCDADEAPPPPPAEDEPKPKPCLMAWIPCGPL